MSKDTTFKRRSKNGNAEIFTSLLLKAMDLEKSRTFKTFVNFNGTLSPKIAQENFSKELVESIGLKESIFLEINEDLYWNWQ